MNGENIELPYNLATHLKKIGIMPISSNKIFLESDLMKVKSLTIKPDLSVSLKGLSLLPALEELIIEKPTAFYTNSKKEYTVPSITDSDVEEIEKSTNLKKLTIQGQDKISYIDLSNLTKLEDISIENNFELKSIDGLNKLNNLNTVNIVGNRTLYKIDGLTDMLFNNDELYELDLDTLHFIDAIGYDYRTGSYNPKAIERIKELDSYGFVKWKETVANAYTTINTYQIINMHNKACNILDSIGANVNQQKKDVIIAIEKYLAENVHYDYQSIGHGHYSSGKSDVNELRPIKGALKGQNGSFNAIMFKEGVCEGYTRAMQYMLKLKGIESHNVHCKLENGVTYSNNEYANPNESNHSIICIDGFECYYADPTSLAASFQMHGSFPFALKTKEEIQKTHKLSYVEQNYGGEQSFPKSELEKSIKKFDMFKETRESNVNQAKRQITQEIAKGQINTERKKDER